MNTDDIFGSSSKASPVSRQTGVIEEVIPLSDNEDQMELCMGELEKLGQASTPQSLNPIKAPEVLTVLEELSVFFKESNLQIPYESPFPSFQRQRIIEMASYVNDGIISDLLLVLLISENASLAVVPLVDCILDIASACPEHTVDRTDLVARIEKVASWEYYGIDGTSTQEEHLQLFRWNILIDNVECINEHDDLKRALINMKDERSSFKQKINSLYAALQDDEKSNLMKRKLRFEETPFVKRQKTSAPSTSGKASSLKASSSKPLKKKKLTASEKAKREGERERKAREKEEEKLRKEEERARKEEEKAKKLEDKLRDKLEKEAVKLKQDEEKARKQLDKEAERKAKDESKAAKEAEKAKKEKSQKRLFGFFKVLDKKPVDEPVAEIISDFALYFRSFTPKATAIVAPINRFDRVINVATFDSSIRKGNDDSVNEKFLAFCKAASLVKAMISVPKAIESAVDPRSWRYMKFAEDVRPPYNGTWTKRSDKVKGKKPFRQDTEIFDYDFDSEAEWEEDEPGEELVSEVEEVDAKEEIEEDPEDGWIVPHGYLSEDEGDVLEQDVDEPTQRGKARSLLPKVINVLVPIVVNPSYSFDGIPQELTVECLYNVRNPFQVDLATEAAAGKKKSAGLKKSIFPPDLTDNLQKYILENDIMTLPKLVEGFVTSNLCKNLTKVAVEAEIKRIAMKEKKQGDSKIRWCVKPESSLAHDSWPLVEGGNNGFAAVPKVSETAELAVDKENIPSQ